MNKVSQKDIAESLNVSRVTVTKALKNHPDISKKTRLLIQNKARELGYIPDFIGRSLSLSKTFTIGIILPKIAHSFFSYSVERFYEEATRKGYNIVLLISFEDPDIERNNILTLLSMRVDGIIIDCVYQKPDIKNYELIEKAGSKVLFFDRYPEGVPYSAVVNNDRYGAYLATKTLIEKGYKKIYHFAGPNYLNISKNRQLGYEDAMSEHGLLKYILSIDLKREAGYDALKKILLSGDKPEAIFSTTDTVALGIYDIMKELNLMIPKDIAVIGYGDIEFASLVKPKLTTIKMPIDEMVNKSINKMIDLIENLSAEQSVQQFDPCIITRESI